MAIKVKNSQLDKNTIQSINELMEKDIAASVAFRLTRMIKELSSIIDDKLEMEKKILDKYVEKDEDGNPVVPVNENGEKIEGSVRLKDSESFNKEMKSLMEVENTLNFDKINFEDLRLDTVKVKNIMKVDFLFE